MSETAIRFATAETAIEAAKRRALNTEQAVNTIAYESKFGTWKGPQDTAALVRRIQELVEIEEATQADGPGPQSRPQS